MIKKQKRTVLFVLAALAAAILLLGLGRWIWARSRLVSGLFDGTVTAYSGSGNDLVITIVPESGMPAGQIQCAPGGAEYISDRVAYIFQQQLTGVHIYANTGEYRVKDAAGDSSFIYPLRTVSIWPGEWQRLLDEGIVDIDDYNKFMEGRQPAVPPA